MVILLNGGSSAGKSSLARCLQAMLPDPWLTLGVDTMIGAMPPSFWGSSGGLIIGKQGEIAVGPAFLALEAPWLQGVAHMARAGARIIFDQVFLEGAAAQARWRGLLAGLPVLWVGVRCDPPVAAAREAARGDRVLGMAALQADLVHQGVVYDVEVDTTHHSPEHCAGIIAAHPRLA